MTYPPEEHEPQPVGGRWPEGRCGKCGPGEYHGPNGQVWKATRYDGTPCTNAVVGFDCVHGHNYVAVTGGE